MTDVLAALGTAATQALLTSRNSSDCTVAISDIDATFASLTQTIQAEFAKLLAAASTTTEKNMLQKTEADYLAALKDWRDKAFAEVTKACASAR